MTTPVDGPWKFGWPDDTNLHYVPNIDQRCVVCGHSWAGHMQWTCIPSLPPWTLPVPVIVPAWPHTIRALNRMGVRVQFKLTDGGHYDVDIFAGRRIAQYVGTVPHGTVSLAGTGTPYVACKLTRKGSYLYVRIPGPPKNRTYGAKIRLHLTSDALFSVKKGGL